MENLIKRVYYGESDKESILWRIWQREYIMENLTKRVYYGESGKEIILWRIWQRDYIMENMIKRVYYGEYDKESILWRTWKNPVEIEKVNRSQGHECNISLSLYIYMQWKLLMWDARPWKETWNHA